MVLVFNLFAWRRKVPSWLKSSRLLPGTEISSSHEAREVGSSRYQDCQPQRWVAARVALANSAKTGVCTILVPVRT